MQDSSLYEILKTTWGYTEFRPLQLDIIHSVLSGRDTLALMPTGGGKSLTFQVPALAMGGLCIVVTPLIALMKDQVAHLRQLGVKATAVYMGMSPREIQQQLDNCILGDYRFLYLSPERLHTQMFTERLHQMDVSLLVVDEAHCISQWGYDFRPAYLQIGLVREKFPDTPVLALTATATDRVVDDIQQQLHFRQPNVLRSSFHRPNLIYSVRYTEEKGSELLDILAKHPGSAIVYVRNRVLTKQIAQYLVEHGISALYYNAGMDSGQRNRHQMAWLEGQARVMVATNAFGMGIDKPDVRLVVHWAFPSTLEEYFQEAGRAGRDRKQAYAIALFDPRRDLATIKARVANTFPEKDFIKRVYEVLCLHYRIAIGTGQDNAYPFNLTEFCIQHKLPAIQTYSALHVLELSGYISLSEEVNVPTRVQITVDRDALYDEVLSPLQSQVINNILRTTTGVFADLVAIDEARIARAVGSTAHGVAECLLSLSRQGIITYVPHRQTPYITLTQIRMPQDEIYITRAAYEQRQEHFSHGIDSVLYYATQQSVCRSQVLVRYFSDYGTQPCGMCDVCLDGQPRQLTTAAYESLSMSVLDVIAAAADGVTPSRIMECLAPADEWSVTETLRVMLDNGRICLVGMRFYLPNAQPSASERGG